MNDDTCVVKYSFRASHKFLFEKKPRFLLNRIYLQLKASSQRWI